MVGNTVKGGQGDVHILPAPSQHKEGTLHSFYGAEPSRRNMYCMKCPLMYTHGCIYSRPSSLLPLSYVGIAIVVDRLYPPLPPN